LKLREYFTVEVPILSDVILVEKCTCGVKTWHSVFVDFCGKVPIFKVLSTSALL